MEIMNLFENKENAALFAEIERRQEQDTGQFFDSLKARFGTGVELR